jgi:homoserine O-acetyltransferase
MRTLLLAVVATLAALFAAPAIAQTTALKPVEGDYLVHGFKFQDGETLPDLKLHYRTLGTARRDASGHVTNAVLILHGTGGTGAQFLRPQFADVLFKPGGLLDPAKYFIILPDGIGHGGSSKPSDGLRMKFPRYDYDDIVAAQHTLVADGLKVDHLRLILGTSMGCMHAFVWGEAWPGYADALMPLACQTVPLAGRNRMWRHMVISGIEADPAWMGGDYKTEPAMGLRLAQDLLIIAGTAPLPLQRDHPTRDSADAYADETLAKAIGGLDANDLIYQVDASRNYNPSPGLERITAPLLWINSADDFINPPELGIAEREVKRIPRATFVLIPASLDTHGHGTHTWAALWQDRLAALLKASEP